VNDSEAERSKQMTENNTEYVYTKAWLESKLEQDRLDEEKAEKERRHEQAEEGLRAAYKDETGRDPSDAELKQMVADMKREDAIASARQNEAQAARQVRGMF